MARAADNDHHTDTEQREDPITGDHIGTHTYKYIMAIAINRSIVHHLSRAYDQVHAFQPIARIKDALSHALAAAQHAAQQHLQQPLIDAIELCVITWYHPTGYAFWLKLPQQVYDTLPRRDTIAYEEPWIGFLSVAPYEPPRPDDQPPQAPLAWSWNAVLEGKGALLGSRPVTTLWSTAENLHSLPEPIEIVTGELAPWMESWGALPSLVQAPHFQHVDSLFIIAPREAATIHRLPGALRSAFPQIPLPIPLALGIHTTSPISFWTRQTPSQQTIVGVHADPKIIHVLEKYHWIKLNDTMCATQKIDAPPLTNYSPEQGISALALWKNRIWDQQWPSDMHTSATFTINRKARQWTMRIKGYIGITTIWLDWQEQRWQTLNLQGQNHKTTSSPSPSPEKK